MKIRKKTATNIFLIALGLTFLFSCTFFDKQTQKDNKKTPGTAEEVKHHPRRGSKEYHKKYSPSADEKNQEHKAVPEQPPPPANASPSLDGSTPQQRYYNMGMRYYSQEKYVEAKKAWQRVIKLGKRTALADKARENIKKVDQILQTLKEISGR